VVDYHVDRLGVEAWQHVKLTSTNRSIGLITSHADKHRLLISMKDIDALINIKSRHHSFIWPGGYGEGPAPDPIPNSVVKTLSANGTAS
jgi:hypothetical protein